MFKRTRSPSFNYKIISYHLLMFYDVFKIFLPESKRTLTGELGRFKRGPFILVKGAGTDIVPMAMINAYRIKRKGSSIIHPGTVELRFGAPIPYQSIKDKNTSEILQITQNQIVKLLDQA